MRTRQSQAALAQAKSTEVEQAPEPAFAQDYGNSAFAESIGASSSVDEPGFFEEAFGPDALSMEGTSLTSAPPPLAPDPSEPYNPTPMGGGRGKKHAAGSRTLKSRSASDTEHGGRAGAGAVYGGVTLGKSRTRRSGDSVETHSKRYKAGVNNSGGTHTTIDASSAPGGTTVHRTEDRGTLRSPKRVKTDTDVTRLGDDTRISGSTNAKDSKGRRKNRKLTPTEQQKVDKKTKDAEDEAGVDKDMNKSGLTKALEHVSFGGVGDETGIDLESFTKERENKTDFTGASSGTTRIPGGDKAAARAQAGVKSSGSVLNETRDVDAFGNERVSRAGANGEGFAGAESEAEATHRVTEDGGKEVAAKAAAKLGVGGDGSAGATTQTQLAEGVDAEAGVQVKGSGFLGAKGSAESKASHNKIGAKASASGKAMAGVEARGSAGGEAAIKAGGFDLAAARAKAEVNGFAGAEGAADGEVSANAITGVKANGSAKAFAGAKADGSGSVGVSLGGVDADGVVEAEAKAGAMAEANGDAQIGPLGAGVGGSVDAFAGAKAGGEARFELGAGGLNFGAIGIQGEVSAGIGVRANGKASLAIHDVGLSGRAGVTYGVGASLGGLLSFDPSFPVRLTLDKLAENNVIPSSDLSELVTAAASLVYKPKAPADAIDAPMSTELPTSSPDTLPEQSDVASLAYMPAGDGMASMSAMDHAPQAIGAEAGMASGAGAGTASMHPMFMMGHAPLISGGPEDLAPKAAQSTEAAPSVKQAPSTKPATPADLSKETSLDSLMVQASPDQQKALGLTQAAIGKQLESTGPAVLNQMKSVVSDGGSLYSDFMGMLGSAFQASEDAKTAAFEGIQELVATGQKEAEGVGQQVSQFASEMMVQISALIATDPGKLLDGGWEAAIDGAVQKVRDFANSAKLHVQAIINRIRAAIAAIAKAALDAALAPVRALVGAVGGVVGFFTARLASAGKAMITGMREGLGPAEKGMRVQGTDGVVALPFAISPMLDIAEGAVNGMSSFGKDAVSEGINSAIDFIAGALEDVIGVESGGVLGGMAMMLTSASNFMFDSLIMMAEGTATMAKPLIRAAVWIYEQMKAAAEAAANWFKALFGIA
ncbi:MAG: hypothetical protein AB8H79_24775 [Myxococcota bacterium]